MKNLFEELVASCRGAVLKDEPMALHTTFRIGGPADIFFAPRGIEDLKKALELLGLSKTPVTVIGKGSNLLVSDAGIRGAVIALAGNFGTVEIKGSRVFALAGVLMNDLIKLCCEKGLGGLEGLAGIPSALGGALSMNMSSKENSISDHVISVSVMDAGGGLVSVIKKDCGFAYRTSGLGRDGGIIVSAELELAAGEAKALLTERENVLKQKSASQPVGYPSAGCIFKNPPSGPAGKLIEKAGLKGSMIGDAMVSDVHANYIVNRGAAKASDVMLLIERIRDAVEKKFGVRLELEVKTPGF